MRRRCDLRAPTGRRPLRAAGRRVPGAHRGRRGRLLSPPPPHARGFLAYNIAVGSFFLPGGLNAVLFSWLVTVALQAPAESVGVAQMTNQLPALLLMLHAGLLADRVDPRRILAFAHMAAFLPPVALAWMVYSDALSYPALLGYAVLAGSANALAMPARDALLATVSGDRLQHGVAVMLGVQFGTQIIGYALASQADRLGPEPLLLLMGCAFLVGAGCMWFIPTPRPHAPNEDVTDAGHIFGGLSHALASEVLRPALLMVLTGAMFFAGTFMVLIPLMIRDHYQGGSAEIAIAFGSMMLGTLVTIAWMIWRGGVRRQGRAQILVALLGGGNVGLMALGMPIGWLYVDCFVWGMLGGIAMTMGRGIVQEHATGALRGRLLAVYSLANFGSIPIGALLLGLVAGQLGALQAALVPATAVTLASAWVLLRTDHWHYESAMVGGDPEGATH